MPNTVAIVLALVAALCWGSADFVARLAGAHIGSRATAFYTQLVSLILLLPILLTPQTLGQGPLPWASLAMALLVGALNAGATTLLYRALEQGQVSLVAPIASSFAVVSALLALLFGERPTWLQCAGIAATGLGVATVSRGEPGPDVPSGRPRGVALALGATLGWGVSFFLLSQVVGALGTVIPIAATRVTAIVGHGGYALVSGRTLGSPRAAWPWILGVSLLDTAAFFAYNASLRGALTSVAVVLASLFSAVTVVLAYVFLHERLSRRQWLAIGLVFFGVGLVSLRGHP